MKGAIMQPYFFPYIGYYQLVYEAENFVFLDDVNWIKKGYINRNSICRNGDKVNFSIPVSKVSQNRKINEHDYTGDFSGFLKLVESAYKKAPFFDSIMPMIEKVVRDDESNVANKNANTISTVFNYLGIKREFLFSSDVSLHSACKGQERILELCRIFGINRYRNASGGRALYDPKSFDESNVELKFVESMAQNYSQSGDEFIPNLSIIDLLMWCDKDTTIDMLKEYRIA